MTHETYLKDQLRRRVLGALDDFVHLDLQLKDSNIGWRDQDLPRLFDVLSLQYLQIMNRLPNADVD